MGNFFSLFSSEPECIKVCKKKYPRPWVDNEFLKKARDINRTICKANECPPAETAQPATAQAATAQAAATAEAQHGPTPIVNANTTKARTLKSHILERTKATNAADAAAAAVSDRAKQATIDNETNNIRASALASADRAKQAKIDKDAENALAFATSAAKAQPAAKPAAQPQQQSIGK